MDRNQNHVSKFYEHLLTGEPFDESSVPPTAALVIADIKQRLLPRVSCKDVQLDLDRLIVALKRNNKRFFSREESNQLQEEQEPTFRTLMVRTFYHQLALLSSGDLGKGVSSNRFVYDALRSAFYDEEPNQRVPVFQQFVRPVNKKPEDEVILHRLLRGHDKEELGAVRFHDARFWGNVAKNLIEKKHQRMTIDVSSSGIQTLYRIKCLSVGKLLDPFSLRLDGVDSTDPTHWTTADHLLAFMKNKPRHPLSNSVKDVCDRLLSSAFDARPLPGFVDRFYDNFLANVRTMDESIPTVESRFVPPKLMDVFHRLLALTKYDVLWKQQTPLEKKEEKNVLFHLYMHVVSLQTEIIALKKLLLKPNRLEYLKDTTGDILDVVWDDNAFRESL